MAHKTKKINDPEAKLLTQMQPLNLSINTATSFENTRTV